MPLNPQFDEARALVASAQEEYRELIGNGVDESEAMSEVIDSYAALPEDCMMLLWGTGTLFDAVKALYDDIADVIREA